MYYKEQNKRKWYKIKKYLQNRNKLIMHKEIQIAVQKIY